MSNTTNFPANPTNGMVHSAEDGVAFTYNSARGVWLRNSASPINVTNNQTFNEQISGTFEAPTTGTPVPLASVTFDTNNLATQSTMTLNNADSSTSRTVELYSAAKVTTLLGQDDNNLGSGATVNSSPIITQGLVDAAVGTGDFVIVDNVLQINNGITSPGFASFVRVNGFLGVRQEASDDTRDIYIVSYRGATHTVYFFKADNTWRSSDSTTDNTNIITPFIGG